MKYIAVLALTLTLAGCENPAMHQTRTQNPSFQVDMLFSHEGCTFYRFWDSQRPVYFMKCVNGQHNIHWEYSCGKNCTHRLNMLEDQNG